MNRVVLNKEEAGWYSRNVLKTILLLEESERRNAGVRERTTYKLLTKMKPQAEQLSEVLKAFGDEPFELEVYLERKEKLLVKGLLETMIKNLKDRIIPEYERRGDKLDPKYLNNAKNKTKMLEKMQRKFK